MSKKDSLIVYITRGTNYTIAMRGALEYSRLWVEEPSYVHQPNVQEADLGLFKGFHDVGWCAETSGSVLAKKLIKQDSFLSNIISNKIAHSMVPAEVENPDSWLEAPFESNIQQSSKSSELPCSNFSSMIWFNREYEGRTPFERFLLKVDLISKEVTQISPRVYYFYGPLKNQQWGERSLEVPSHYQYGGKRYFLEGPEAEEALLPF